MGKDATIVEDAIEDVLGLNTQSESEDTPADESDNKAQEGQSEEPKRAEYITMTSEQVKIQSEITKLDTQIDKFKENSSIDMDKFYAQLEESLSEEEQALELENRPAYLKLVSQKEKEYIKAHSNDEEIKALEEKKAEFENMNRIQEGILEVTKSFPDYNHEKMLAFFKDELSIKEQEKIYEGCKSFADVYKNTYKKYLERNPSSIRKGEDNPLPNVNNARRQNVTANEIDDGMESSEDKLKNALGL